MCKVVESREWVLRVKLNALDIRRSRRARLALDHVPRDNKSNNPRRFMGIVRAPWIDSQARVTADWGLFCKACSPCVTEDFITLQSNSDLCLRCEGCRKCNYRYLGGVGGCEGCSYGTKHKYSDGRRMFRVEDYAAHIDDCERSKRVLLADSSALSSEL